MPALPTVARPCIEEALARSPQMVGHAVDHAAEALLEAARKARGNEERQQLAAAADELQRARLQWCAGIGSSLRKAIASSGAQPPAVRLNPSSLTLTLVDDSEVMQSIETSRLAQQLAGTVEKSLGELDRYMSSALQLDGIQPELNPLRPAIFAQALRELMNDPPPAADHPALWMRHMADPLAEDLKALYESCSNLLASANVQAADYRVVTGPAPLAPRSGNAPLAPASGASPLRQEEADSRGRSAMSGWVELATERIGGPALREFLFGPAPHTQQPLAPSYYQQIDAELEALEAGGDETPADPEPARSYRHMPVVERPARAVGTETALSREAWGDYGAPRQRSLVRTRLRKQAQSMGQAIGIDVVRQLVDQVAQDPRLLAPVREAMVALEPSLARLAMHSPRFFAEQDNPARRLLEGVSQRSFKYNDEFSSEFQEFFEPVRQRFNALNRLETVTDPKPFEDALAQLAGQWADEDRSEQAQRREVIEAVELAERRQGEADKIASELSQRSDLDGVPAVVQEFLLGPWALVIANARMGFAGGEVDPGGYLGVVTDLLWSAKTEATLRDPARAFEVIPRVLPRLRAGLDKLGHAAWETESFFQALERLHQPVMKLRAKHRRQSFESDSSATPLEIDLKPAPAQKPQARDEPWLRDGELRNFGFEDTMPSDYTELESDVAAAKQAAPANPPAATPAPAKVQAIPVTRVGGVPLTESQADSLILTLREGCWVDLFSKQKWRRARLTWASGKRTLFMFESHGGQPHSMTKRSLQRLVVNRLVRPVDSHEVVQHAIEALVRPRSEALAA